MRPYRHRTYTIFSAGDSYSERDRQGSGNLAVFRRNDGHRYDTQIPPPFYTPSLPHGHCHPLHYLYRTRPFSNPTQTRQFGNHLYRSGTYNHRVSALPRGIYGQSVGACFSAHNLPVHSHCYTTPKFIDRSIFY